MGDETRHEELRQEDPRPIDRRDQPHQEGRIGELTDEQREDGRHGEEADPSRIPPIVDDACDHVVAIVALVMFVLLCPGLYHRCCE